MVLHLTTTHYPPPRVPYTWVEFTGETPRVYGRILATFTAPELAAEVTHDGPGRYLVRVRHVGSPATRETRPTYRAALSHARNLVSFFLTPCPTCG